MRGTVVSAAALVLATMLAGCTTQLSEGNFELKATEIGWRVGQDALFTLRFNPDGADPARYDIDPVFAITEVRFEKDGLNAFGDYETKRAQDVAIALLREGSVVGNFTLTPAQSTIQIRVHIPDQLTSGEYRLELKLFKIGWVKSDLFRIAV